MSLLWSKFDEKGLARFVLPDAIRRVSLPLNRADLPATPQGRRRLVEVTYESLLAKDIRYAPERYHPERAEQQIRSPHEILYAPREGTCLDLSVLFAGVCVGFELLPVVVVTESHALCAVSLTHGAREWDAFDRREREGFEEPVRDPAVLAGLVESGSFLAVECTGFAHSETLPVESIEGQNRRDGVLSFVDAVDAGRRQLERTDSPLRFAIDVTVAHYHWRLTPPTLPAQHQIATEGLIAEQIEEHGLRLGRVTSAPEVRPFQRPVAPLISPPDVFVGRDVELESVRAGMASRTPVWIQGRTGVGKTTLLRRMAFDTHGEAHSDGVVYLGGIADPDDAAQQIWESFFDSDPGYRPSQTRIGQALRGLDALVLVDDAEVDAVEPVSGVMRESRFVIAREGQERGSGATVQLEGLGDEYAADLFERHSGLTLAAEERATVVELCRSLGGHPSKIVDAARMVADGHATLTTLAGQARSSSEAPSRTRLDSLPSSEQKVISLLAVFGDAGVARAHVEALVGADAASAVRSLVEQDAIEAASPRYRLAGTWMGAVVGSPELDAAKSAAKEHFTDWVRTASLEEVVESLPELLQVIGWAQQEGDARTVVSIGKEVEKALALSRRWGAWGTVLEATRAAAVNLGDESVEAHALHQMGTRARLLGGRKTGRKLLKQARDMRRRLGDDAGAGVSSHNLRFTRPPWMPWIAGGAMLGAIAGGVAVVCMSTNLCFAPAVPEVGVAPTELDFHKVAAGTESPTLSVRIFNSSQAPAALGPGVVDGDQVFELETDCAEVLDPGEECFYFVSFTPPLAAAFSASLLIGVEDSAPLTVNLTGVGIEPDVTIDPDSRSDFGVVRVDEEEELEFTLSNRGDAGAQLLQGPSVEGEFFSLVSDDCGQVVEPGDSCSIVVSFSPRRDHGEGLEDRDHDGQLVVQVDGVDTLAVPLAGTSSFFLPDLTIELHDAIPTERVRIGMTVSPALVQFPAVDLVVTRIRYTVHNVGRGDADGFLVTAWRMVEGGWETAVLSDERAALSPVSIESTLGSGEKRDFTRYVLIPRGDLDVGASMPLRLSVDSCVAQECAVAESNEDNNFSATFDANPVVGRTEVELYVLDEFEVLDEFDSTETSAGRYSNAANLVADALHYHGDTVGAVGAVLDGGALVIPGDQFRAPTPIGELRALHLVDLAPSGHPVTVREALPALLKDLFDVRVAGEFSPNHSLHVSEPSRYSSHCPPATPERVLSLVIGEVVVVDEGDLQVDAGTLSIVVTNGLAGSLGQASDEEAPTIAEVLRSYVTGPLDEVIRADRYPEDGTDHFRFRCEARIVD